mmetsp:Transcript_9688/g.27400  ORF Transcript_9688/g.27400 Transcript_9688/m.27400 type:complete len:265 (+) Transcript_9688:97-891(+)
MMLDSRTSRRGSSGCGGCLCLAFLLMIFATASPYWVWRRSYMFNGAVSTIATGSFVISSSSTQWRCGWYATCAVIPTWTHIDSFNATLCEGEYFEKVGRFGFCESEGADEVQTPSKIQAIQGLSIASCVVLAFASIMALSAPAAGRKVVGFSASGCSFIAAVLTCAAFSVAVSYDWYQSFSSIRDGGFFPLVTNDGQLFVSDQLTAFWGPGFYCTVFAFIISLLATCSMGAVSNNLNEDLDGTYGAGARGEQEPFAGGYDVEKT